MMKKESTLQLLSAAAPAAMQESYRRIRAQLMARVGLGADRSHAELCPVIGVTALDERPGRSYLAANLSISLAKVGLRVLLVDADYREAGLASLLGMEENEGLYGYATGKQSLIQKTAEPSLSYLARGTVEGEPADFLGSNAFLGVIEENRALYDVILVSLSAIGRYADTATAAPALGGVVLGVCTGKDKRQDFAEAIATLQSISLPIYGAVALDD